MEIKDIKTAAEAAHYLVRAQRVYAQANREITALEARFAELEDAESKTDKKSK